MVSPSRRANPWGTPVRQVGVACATRHDIPHRTHHQRVCPGGSGRRVRCPRMSGANSAVSNGRTIRAGIPASGGPGLGSTSPHVSREPRPVGTGLFGGGAVCSCGGSASGPSTEYVMRISFWVGGRWHDSKWASTIRPRRPRTGCGDIARSATRASRCLLPTTSLVFRPGLQLPGRGTPTCPSPSPRETRGGGVIGAWGVTGGDPWWARIQLHAATRGQPRGPPPTPFPGVWLPTCGKPRGGPPFWTGTGTWGRANNNNKRE